MNKHVELQDKDLSTWIIGVIRAEFKGKRDWNDDSPLKPTDLYYDVREYWLVQIGCPFVDHPCFLAITVGASIGIDAKGI